MIVSISRELGAGGGTLGDALSKTLNAALLDERWFIAQLIERYQYPSEYLERRLEQPPKFGESLMATLARATAMVPGASTLQMPDEQLIDGVRSLVLEQAQQGHAVVIGHGGVSMLGWRPTNIPVLSILLQAGKEWRIEQLARRYAISRDEAARRIKATDEARVRYQQHYFNTHIYDCALYDLVFNTEVLGLDNTVALACTAVRTLLSDYAAATSAESAAKST
ncbi:MAG: cytidylate kinase-like family protein [Candidatus Lustribacter sp.]|jgi:cytidylate kinase